MAVLRTLDPPVGVFPDGPVKIHVLCDQLVASAGSVVGTGS